MFIQQLTVLTKHPSRALFLFLEDSAPGKHRLRASERREIRGRNNFGNALGGLFLTDEGNGTDLATGSTAPVRLFAWPLKENTVRRGFWIESTIDC
jgi:hypothetical protein